jgi:hypothetical protein
LRQPFRIDLPSRARGPKEVTGAVAVQGTENSFRFHYLAQSSQYRHRRFLFHQLRVIDPVRRIVQNHQQVTPAIILKPVAIILKRVMPAPIDVQQHPR